jgi:Ni/Co efflux regulator RcnB
MSKILATCAAVAVTALIALPAPASAAEKNAPAVKQGELTDISAARRIHRGYVRHHYRPYYSRGYYAPYDAYAYDPYYRPYYRPGFSVGVGPFGFGLGF